MADGHDLLITALPSIRYPGGGHPFNPKKLNERLKMAEKRAGLESYTVHSLRHLFNTHYINSGVPERVVRMWMGHHDRSMTGIYYDLTDAESRRFMRSVCFDDPGAQKSAAQLAAKIM